MKIEYIRLGGGPMTFSDFAERNGLELQVRERPLHMGPASRFYCCFKKAEISDGGMLVGAHGDGDTPEAAIADYQRRLVGQRLVVNAYEQTRRTIQCPNEWLEGK